MNTHRQMDLFRRVEIKESGSALNVAGPRSLAAEPVALADVLNDMGNVMAFAKTAPDAFWDGMKLDDQRRNGTTDDTDKHEFLNMAYFSNGTEGMMYQERFCERCANWRDKDDGRGPGSAVWDAHVLFAYEECNNKSNAKSILDILIPQKDYGWPEECSMFLESGKTDTIDDESVQGRGQNRAVAGVVGVGFAACVGLAGGLRGLYNRKADFRGVMEGRVIERPILFKAEMVRAILSGRKTQTRRIVKPQPMFDDGRWWKRDRKGKRTAVLLKSCLADGKVLGETHLDALETINELWKPPYGITGDHLWVRETFAEWHGEGTIYRATASPAEVALADDASTQQGIRFKWKPSIFMRRGESRIDLKIKSVRVERLNDIRTEDCLAEGIDASAFEPYRDDPETNHFEFGVKTCFQALWNIINGKNAWKKNPWVWVYEFERIRP